MLRKRVTALLMTAALAAGFSAAGSSVYAQAAEKGLKDIYANYFRIGTCYPSQHTSDATLRNIILREFNSVTHENGLKPDATMSQNGSTDENIRITFNNEAKNVMQFCVNNNIPLRGHTLVWHSQMPDWFFRQNFQSSGQWASRETMLKRMESYIKNIFAELKSQYPDLNIYAYDVVNEIYDNDGKPRKGGTGSEESRWVQIFGDNSFADSAFVFARKYAPEGCKLFYNDYNEYMGKADTMVAMANRLGPKGRNVMDGIGMQSHLATNYPSVSTYTAALNKFIGTGLEIHVTELDITIENGSNETAQANLYRGVFDALYKAKENGANITSVSVWGIRDDLSWRGAKNPLLFTSSYGKKPAYNSVAALVPEENHGDGRNPGVSGYSLAVNVSPKNSGTVTKDPDVTNYPKDTPVTVTLTPTANTGWKFDRWEGVSAEPGQNNAVSVVMNKNTVAAAIFVPTADGTVNLVKDGNFPGTALTSNWDLKTGQYYGNSEAAASVSNGKAAINITNAGSESHHPQLIQLGVELNEGMTYRLTFKASAAAQRSVYVLLQNSGDYTTYADSSFNLTDTEETFTLVFKMEHPTDVNTQLAFNLGGTGAVQSVVTISDVKLIHLAAPSAISYKNTERTAAKEKSTMRVKAKSSSVNVSFKAVKGGETVLKLYGLKGDVISTAKVKTTAGKNYSHTFKEKRLPNGFYVVRMQSGNIIEQSKVILPK